MDPITLQSIVVSSATNEGALLKRTFLIIGLTVAGLVIGLVVLVIPLAAGSLLWWGIGLGIGFVAVGFVVVMVTLLRPYFVMAMITSLQSYIPRESSSAIELEGRDGTSFKIELDGWNSQKRRRTFLIIGLTVAGLVIGLVVLVSSDAVSPTAGSLSWLWWGIGLGIGFVVVGFVVAVVSVLRSYFHRNQSLEMQITREDGKIFQVMAKNVSANEVSKTLERVREFLGDT